MNRSQFALLVGLACCAEALGAPRLTRGPYLQMATPDSIVVRWRTDALAEGTVLYGTTPENATNKVSHAGKLAEHVVRIGGLKPSTRYLYSIQGLTPKLRQFGPEWSAFTTPPPRGTPKPTRVWVLGDPGTATRNQAAVRDAFLKWTGDRSPDLWLMLGDNAYSTGTDAEYQKAVFAMYPDTLRTSPLWPTLGNHDAGSANSGTESGVYYDIFTLPARGQAGGLPSGTEAYYAFDHANIHFVCLDSHDTDRSKSGAMAQWLRADLESTTQEWIVCFFHHPPYTKGTHDSDNPKDSAGRMVEMRENLLPILEEGGVDLVLTGHSHNYERSHLLDRSYGFSTNTLPSQFLNKGDGRPDGDGPYRKPPGTEPHKGAVYVVAGSSGQTESGTLNHPVMFLSLKKLGSMVLDVEGSELKATFLTDRAKVLDYFTIRKQP